MPQVLNWEGCFHCPKCQGSAGPGHSRRGALTPSWNLGSVPGLYTCPSFPLVLCTHPHTSREWGYAPDRREWVADAGQNQVPSAPSLEWPTTLDSATTTQSLLVPQACSP